jgi:membrane-bound serine protease (ClpP class)
MFRNIRHILSTILILAGTLVFLFHMRAPAVNAIGTSGANPLTPLAFATSDVVYNWVGILLIVAAVAAFIAEFFIGFTGLLFLGGIIALIVGFILMIQGGLIFVQLDPWVIVVTAVVVVGMIAFAVNRIISTYRRQATTGKENFKGKKALVKQALNPQGFVLFEGELWTAESESGLIEPGEEVIVTNVEGLKLWVKKK